MKILMCSVSFAILLMLAGCGSTPEANSNTVAANTNLSNSRIQNVDASNLPPAPSASPLAPTANSAPGISTPVNTVNSVSKGATPTPGIPDPSTLGKPSKPGATPTPGIPDPATMKKQMEEIRKRLNSNSNQPQPPPPPGAGDGQMMRKQRKIVNANN
ncbi:MAG: hypothetical protein ABIR33_12185 [Pyrinomonadaceae bacterium]